MDKLTKKFNESIIVETNEISKDIIEIGIDSVLNEGLFKKYSDCKLNLVSC